MLKVAWRELTYLLLKLSVLAISTQFLVYLLPGDPVEMILEQTGLSMPPEQLRSELGLDQSLIKRVSKNLISQFKGDFGVSLYSKKPVFAELIIAFTTTAKLVSAGYCLGILMVCILLPPMLGMRRRNYSARSGLKKLHLLWNATPSPILALVWLYLGSKVIVFGALVPMFWLGSLFLSTGIAINYTRFLLQIWEDEQPKVLWNSARARGLSPIIANLKYAIAPRLGAFLSWTSTHLGQLFAGLVVTELVFNFSGLGSLFLEALSKRDYPMIQGTFLWCGLVLFVGQSLGDLLAFLWNPRLR